MVTHRGVVVVPAYGLVELTAAVVVDCVRERQFVDVIVVDNAGDYHPRPEDREVVTVLRPGRNLGWLRGTNAGFSAALEGPWTWVAGLNNDTRLGSGFFAGITEALRENPSSMVAPCYDDIVKAQTSYYTGPLEGFVPEPLEESTSVVDGTFFALGTDVVREVGLLDAQHFGRRGWGAMEDYALRVREHGGQVLVTRRSYLQHSGRATANATMSTYHRFAEAEMRRGMRRKHGADWRRHFPPFDQQQEDARTRLRDWLRALEDRAGLSETTVGRKGWSLRG